MPFEVVVYRLTTPVGDMYVCTDGTLKRLQHDDSEPAKAMLKRLQQLITDAEQLRFTMRVYTWGERIQCESEATDWSSGTPRLDVGRLRLLLLAKSLDMTEQEVAQLHPQLGDLLYTELEHHANPSPFAWTFASSKQQNSEMANRLWDAPKSRSSKRGSEESRTST